MKNLENQFWINELKKQIRDIPDYPYQGCLFKDFSEIFKNPLFFHKATSLLTEKIKERIEKPDIIVGVEPNGLIIGSQIASFLSAGFVSLRKSGLNPPQTTLSINYNSIFGEGKLEINKNSFVGNQKILIIDDILASGGLVESATTLLKRMNVNVVGWAFLLELTSLMGSDSIPVCSLIQI